MKSYLKFLSRNKLYTAIEAVGLAVSLAFVIIIGSYVVQQFEVKYENPLWRDIYTFAMVEDGHPDQLGLTYTFTDAIQEAAPEVEVAGRLSLVDYLLFPEEGMLKAKIVTADRHFFELFPNLKFVEGGPEVLSDAGNMIISEEFSHKSGLKVGDKWKLGKDAFTVAAIMRDWKSTLFDYADVVLSIDGPVKTFSDPNDQFGSVCTFVKLRPGADRNALEEKAVAVCKRLYDTYGSSFLQGVRIYRLDELIFGDAQSGTFVSGNIAHSDKRTLDLLLVAVLLLLVSAVFNYINLNMALSAKRAREMATRRLIGASQASVFGRRILESVLFTLVCFAVSLLLSVHTQIHRHFHRPGAGGRVPGGTLACPILKPLETHRRGPRELPRAEQNDFQQGVHRPAKCAVGPLDCPCHRHGSAVPEIAEPAGACRYRR